MFVTVFSKTEAARRIAHLLKPDAWLILYSERENGEIIMRFKDTKRYITVTKENVNQFIKYIMTARNIYIDQGKPVDDVNDLLIRFMNAKKKLRA